MNTQCGLVYDPAHPDICLLDIYTPDDMSAATPVYLYIHGGGLEGGSRECCASQAARLTAQGVAFVAIDYRLYPAARYPDYLEDAARAVRFVLRESPLAPCAGGLVVGGSSAGGYLSLMLHFCPTFLQDVGVGQGEIAGWFFDAGQPTTHFSYLKYEKGLDPRCVLIDETAPLFYLREPFAHPASEPHLFIAAADHDMVNRREQLEVLRTALLHFGFDAARLTFRVYENEGHCSYCDKAFYADDLTRFIKNAVQA